MIQNLFLSKNIWCFTQNICEPKIFFNNFLFPMFLGRIPKPRIFLCWTLHTFFPPLASTKWSVIDTSRLTLSWLEWPRCFDTFWYYSTQWMLNIRHITARLSLINFWKLSRSGHISTGINSVWLTSLATINSFSFIVNYTRVIDS